MAGASLKPEYFNSKINVAVLLAPPISLKNIQDYKMWLAAAWPMRQTITEATLAIGAYDTLPYSTFNSSAESEICTLFDGMICSAALKWFLDGDPSIDNKDRYPVFMSNITSGACYREFVHYA